MNQYPNEITMSLLINNIDLTEVMCPLSDDQTPNTVMSFTKFCLAEGQKNGVFSKNQTHYTIMVWVD